MEDTGREWGFTKHTFNDAMGEDGSYWEAFTWWLVNPEETKVRGSVRRGGDRPQLVSHGHRDQVKLQ